MESKKDYNKVITEKDLNNLAIRSVFLQASFNYERMQSGGWTYMMLPELEKIYKNDKNKLSMAMKDNLDFINTHPILCTFLVGLLISLEESGEDRELIKGLKVGLFGPIAGIGDALFWFTLLPIVAGICGSMAMDGNVVGPIIFFVVYLVAFLIRIPLTKAGYKLGASAIDFLEARSQDIARAASVLGVTVMGALVANYVAIEVLTTIKTDAGNEVAIQADFLDKIFPNILPMAYTMLMYYLIKKKKTNPSLLILMTFILAILLSAVGVL